jgi:hypothetical protein
MIEIVPHANGAIVTVRAQPGAKTSALRGEHGGALKVAVAQVAEKGKANQAILETLAECLGLARSQVELVSGPTSREKRVLVRGLTVDALRSRIEGVLCK